MPAPNRRRGVALGLWTVTLVTALGAVLLIIATRDTTVPTPWAFRGASELFGITCGTVGAIVALRRPGNRIGWLFGIIGLGFATQAVVNGYVVTSTFLVAGGLPATTFLAWTLTWSWVPPLGIALIFLPLLFPSGQLLSPRWRAVSAIGVMAVIGFSVAAAFIPGPIQQVPFIDNPYARHGMDRATYSSVVFGPASLLLVTSIALSIGSLVVRFRRAGTEMRQQIKWFALAALLAGTAFVSYVAVSFVEVASASKPLEILAVLALMGLPTAAGMAILRYRLYDIDRIVSRTVSYVVLSLILFGMFAVVTIALQALISPITGGDSLAVAASTLLVAGLVAPIRSRVQRTVDRRFDRARYDADRTAVAFGERLRDQVDMTALAEDLTSTVRASVAPTAMGLWMREGRR